ncbi:hypothetical protein [Fibrella forsythiae]|uniref:Uncharacterized protein n=1 Tax=Fibrella forsythiae TaxID=2817061 RepID=A0ABS3JPK1_9BACT|nr:hypothetical protein [Fibrella forsythiae]MBO0951134.1 hypothetical protein [Fibrella forsythiae]
MMSSAYTLPVWITDEQQLRDEAVLFGLSEARPDEKIASIRMAFAALTAPLEKEIEQHQESIGHLNLLLEQLDRPQTPEAVTVHSSRLGGWPLGTCLIGLAASLGLCASMYVGTLALLNSHLALLLAALTGAGGVTATFFICQARYRQQVAGNELLRIQHQDDHKQRLVEQANWQQQKRVEIDQLYRAEASLNQQQAHRDLLIRLFESEFDLARSLRHHVRDQFVDM